MWKNFLERGQATDDNMAHACLTTKATYTLRIRNTYCFSTATVIAINRLNDSYTYITCLFQYDLVPCSRASLKRDGTRAETRFGLEVACAARCCTEKMWAGRECMWAVEVYDQSFLTSLLQKKKNVQLHSPAALPSKKDSPPSRSTPIE